MCNHKFEKYGDKSCKWDDFFSQMRLKEIDIPNDMLYLPHDSTGECIFHSRDLEWKRKNNFIERLKYLILLVDKYDEETDSIELEDFVLIGDTPIEHLIKSYDVDIDSTGNSFCIWFENLLCNKRLVLDNVIVEEPMVIERCCFKDEIKLVGCRFSQKVFINHFVIGKELRIVSSDFKDDTIIATDLDSIIYGAWYVEDSEFRGNSTTWQGLSVYGSCSIEYNDFGTYTVFNDVFFNNGVLFRNNKGNHTVIDSCTFYGESIWQKLEIDIFEMLQPYIGGTLHFVGEENKLLFNTQTVIDIDENCFIEGEIGLITFDYCNILGLGATFIENCRDLEAKQKVNILPSCKVERLTMIYEYPLSTELNLNLIADFANIVRRYFYHWYGINLSVNIVRDIKKRLLRVIYKTTDDITAMRFEDLLQKLPETICSATGSEPEVKDLQRVLIDITQRIVSNDRFGENAHAGYLAHASSVLTEIHTLSEVMKNTLAELENNYTVFTEYVKNILEKNVKEGKRTDIYVEGNYIDASGSQNGVVGGEKHTFKKPVIKKQISKKNINVNLEKKKSFWSGFIGALVIGVIGCAIWYFIQKLIE